MKVFVVTDGWYSDYHIMCVCSTREKALEAIAVHSLVEANIDEYELDAFNVPPAGMSRWIVQMEVNGDTRDAFTTPFPITGQIAPTKTDIARRNTHIYPPFSCQCWARDREHAIKIANEHRVQAIASGELK